MIYYWAACSKPVSKSVCFVFLFSLLENGVLVQGFPKWIRYGNVDEGDPEQISAIMTAQLNNYFKIPTSRKIKDVKSFKLKGTTKASIFTDKNNCKFC